MQRLVASVCFVALLITGFLVRSAVPVAAQTGQGELKPVDSTLYQTVTMDCLAVKFKINEIHRADKLLRVTMGESYDNISTNLMGNLNTRIVQNKLDGSELIKIAAEFEEAHKSFRDDYMRYDDSLVDLIKADCQSGMQTYYSSLQTTRELRADVEEDVVKLNEIIEQYHTAFKEFRDKIETKDETDE